MNEPPPLPPPTPRAVLLFDGDCGLCQRVVEALLRCDPTGRLHYAALQSPSAQSYLRAQGLPTQDFESLVFVPDWNNSSSGDCRLRTDGALAAAQVVGGVLRLFTWLRWVPRSWRDAAYRGVARVRQTLFSHRSSAPRRRPEWNGRFVGE